MISPQTIQQITSRIDILDVVGEFVKLRKRGTSYLGLCPFHGEKSPSFTVSPAKEIYKCFGCGKSGNSITFLMEHEKYSYVEAMRWLAHRYNIDVEETAVSPEIKQQQLVADSLFAINSFAQKFFADQLWNTEEGQNIALSYLEERGFNKEITEKFQIGYNPQSRYTFAQSATKNQFNPDLLLRTGLVANRNDEMVDNYRGRIIFPIHNNTGKIIGFGARVIGKADKAPKYINTPENELYIKSKILYGSYFARQAIDKNDECLLVEGYTDVVSMHQAGIENVVASGGTSLTIDQLRLVKKYTNNLTIIYDGDAAGIKAALRGLDMALEESLNVKLVLIPDKEDPDSYVKKVGAAEFRSFIAENKKDFILFQLEVMLKEAGTDVNRKNDVVNQVAETLSKISKTEDFTKQQEYIRQCSGILRIDETGLTNLVNKYKRDRVTKEEKKQHGQGGQGHNQGQQPFDYASAEPIDDFGNSMMPPDMMDDTSLLVSHDEAHERNVLKMLLEYGLNNWDEQKTVAQYVFEELEEFYFDSQELDMLFTEYRRQYLEGLEPTTKTLLYHENEQIRTMVVNVSMFPFELSQRWDEKLINIKVVNRDNSIQDLTSSLLFFKSRKLKTMLDQNQRDLEVATSADEQMRLIKIHYHLKEAEKELLKATGTVILK
jgi:DNA primase